MSELSRSDIKLDEEEIAMKKIFIADTLILGAIEVNQLRDIQRRFSLDKDEISLLEGRGVTINTEPIDKAIEQAIGSDMDDMVADINWCIANEPSLAIEIIAGATSIPIDSVTRVNDSILPVVGGEVYIEDVTHISIGGDMYKKGVNFVYLADGHTA